MRVYICRLVLHENLFYATREIGRLYETGRYLHNYALTFALGLAVAPYFHREQIPSYEEQLAPLNERGIYVTPARGVDIAYELNTFKYANKNYHVEMVKSRRNTPSYGRAKEIAVGSSFEFAVLSEEPSVLPRWIRLGLWRSKAEVQTLAEVEATLKPSQTGTTSYPMNPLDLPGRLVIYDLISMPPVSVVDRAVIEGDWWAFEASGRRQRLPAGLRYTFPEQ